MRGIGLSDLAAIGDAGLYRAKISNGAARITLLSEAKRLKNSSNFQQICFYKDLFSARGRFSVSIRLLVMSLPWPQLRRLNLLDVCL